MKTKTINLGYVPMEGYKATDSLWPDWMIEEAAEGKDEYGLKARQDIRDTPPDEQVLPAGTYVIRIHYPVRTEFAHLVTALKGFTRRTLVNTIVKCYVRMYAQEDKAVGDPGNIPGMFNRATSEGPYGIWGHCLGDLILHTAHVKKANKKEAAKYGADWIIDMVVDS